MAGGSCTVGIANGSFSNSAPALLASHSSYADGRALTSIPARTGDATGGYVAPILHGDTLTP